MGSDSTGVASARYAQLSTASTPGSRLWAVLALLAACGSEVPRFDGDAFRRDPPQIGSLAGRAIATNNNDDTLSVLDPALPGPPQKLPVGLNAVELEGPHHLSVDPAGRYLYVNLTLAVAGSGAGPHGSHGEGTLPGYVIKIDVATARTVALAPVDPNPGDSTLSADGRTLYVTHYDVIRWTHAAHGEDLRKGDSNLVLIDTEKMTVTRKVPICPAAHGVRLSPDERWLYAACGPDEIAVVDLAANPPSVRRVLFPQSVEDGGCRICPYGVGVAPDGMVWVGALGPASGANGRGTIEIYDPKQGGTGGFAPGATIRLRGSATFPVFAAAGGNYRAYVPEQSATESWVRIYEPGPAGSAPREVGALRLDRDQCLRAHMALVSPDGRSGQLVCEGDRVKPGTFVWLELDPPRVVGAVPIGVFPDGLALVPPPR